MVRQKDNTWIIIITVIIALLIFNQTKTEFGRELGGNEFYEYRCINVSDYVNNQGYTLDHIDENGCEIVRKYDWGEGGTINRPGKCWECYSGSGSDSCQSWMGGSWYKYSCSGQSCVCKEKKYYYQGGYVQVVSRCHFEDNDLLAAETFSGPVSLNINSTRYPIKAFCKAHPAIITDNNLKVTETDTTIYKIIMDGGIFNITDYQTVTLFYIIENNYMLPSICDSEDNLAYNVDTEVCDSTIGFTYICSVGVFDALTGTCVIRPNASLICEKGRYDVNLDLCVYNPPIHFDCGDNSSCYYSIDKEKCVCYAIDAYECPLGYIFEEPKTKEECQDIGGIWDECPQCPPDKECGSHICSARCTKGKKCVKEPPSLIICNNSNATIIDGECVVNGTTYILCEAGSEYNPKTGKCELEPTKTVKCEDGSSPIIDPETGKAICYIRPKGFVSCDENKVYDPSVGKCVDYIIMYDPITGDFINYSVFWTGSFEDSNCTINGVEYYFDSDTGVCYVQTGIVKDGDPVKKTKVEIKPFGMTIVIVIVAALIYILLYTKRQRSYTFTKKPRKKTFKRRKKR